MFWYSTVIIYTLSERIIINLKTRRRWIARSMICLPKKRDLDWTLASNKFPSASTMWATSRPTSSSGRARCPNRFASSTRSLLRSARKRLPNRRWRRQQNHYYPRPSRTSGIVIINRKRSQEMLKTTRKAPIMMWVLQTHRPSSTRKFWRWQIYKRNW